MTTPRTRKVQEGSYLRPHRDTPQEPMPTEEIGAPLMRLKRGSERKWFDKLKKQLHKGTAFQPDNIALCILARQLARIENTVIEKIQTAQTQDVMRNLAAFGLTPSARRKVMEEARKEEDPSSFARFITGKKMDG